MYDTVPSGLILWRKFTCEKMPPGNMLARLRTSGGRGIGSGTTADAATLTNAATLSTLDIGLLSGEGAGDLLLLTTALGG